MNESLFLQYINTRMSALDLQNELKRLIGLYNKAKGTYLLVYAVDFEKAFCIQGLNISITMLERQIASKSRKFPEDNRIECECGFTFDLTGIRNQLENQFGKKIVN